MILFLLLLPWLQGCTQGELTLLINDIKQFYLNGGFNSITETDSQNARTKPAESSPPEVILYDCLTGNPQAKPAPSSTAQR